MNRRFSTGGTTTALKSYADHRKNQMTSTPKAEMSINSRTSSHRHESFDFPSIIDKRFVSTLLFVSNTHIKEHFIQIYVIIDTFFLHIKVCLLIHAKAICST